MNIYVPRNKFILNTLREILLEGTRDKLSCLWHADQYVIIQRLVWDYSILRMTYILYHNKHVILLCDWRIPPISQTEEICKGCLRKLYTLFLILLISRFCLSMIFMSEVYFNLMLFLNLIMTLASILKSEIPIWTIQLLETRIWSTDTLFIKCHQNVDFLFCYF